MFSVKKFTTVFAMLFFSILNIAAQNTLPDSMVKRFESASRDSLYIDKLNVISFEYLKSKPSLARELSIYTQAEAKAINYKNGYARALSIVGSSFWYEGIYEVAQNYYLAAARQYQLINDSLGLSKMYNNIGEVYKKLNQFDKSLEYQLLSLELNKNNLNNQRLTLYNIGETYLKLNQVSKGKEYINKALEFAKRADDKRVMAYCYWAYGNISVREKNLDKAIAFYQLSERLDIELGEKRSLIQTYQDVADAHRIQKDFKKAYGYINAADSIARSINAQDLMVKNHFYRFKLDSTIGNMSDAVSSLYQYNLLRDSLYNLSKSEQINRMQTVFETERRERENEQLRTEKDLRDTQLNFQNLIIVSIAIGLFIASILLVLVLRQRKKILMTNQQLSEKTEEVQSQAESLIQLNTDLQNLNKNLETIVEQRTAQVMDQNQKLSEYTFINAHKLRAPVATILGLISLLPTATDAEKEKLYGYLKVCSENLDAIIREIGKNLEAAIVDKEK
jgi:tetratricopeptide (TPR) repeat protein